MNNSFPGTIGIVAAEFNKPLVDAMVTAATQELADAGAAVGATARVPGSYELPLVVATLLAQPRTVAVVVLGYIERGQTLHGEVMGHVVHDALVRLQLEFKKPVGVGIIGPGATAEQAEVRKLDYARAAARAALASLRVLRELNELGFLIELQGD